MIAFLFIDLATIAVFFAYLYDLKASNKLAVLDINLLTAALSMILIRIELFTLQILFLVARDLKLKDDAPSNANLNEDQLVKPAEANEIEPEQKEICLEAFDTQATQRGQ